MTYGAESILFSGVLNLGINAPDPCNKQRLRIESWETGNSHQGAKAAGTQGDHNGDRPDRSPQPHENERPFGRFYKRAENERGWKAEVVFLAFSDRPHLLTFEAGTAPERIGSYR